jgi:Chitobiase/beta-hexosaminidase C-terminal domain
MFEFMELKVGVIMRVSIAGRIKGSSMVILLCIVLAACGAGSAESDNAAPGDSTVTVPSPAPSPIPTPTPNAPLAVSASPFGSTYGTTQSVTISANKTDAKIYYTANGTTPTVSSTLYSAPISISANATLKFIARDSAGNVTPVVTENYTIDTLSFIASATPVAGSYAEAQYIKLSANKPGTTIYYTTDGSTPTTNSKIYTNPVNTGINKTLTIKFFGRDLAGNASAVTQANYNIGSTITDIKIENTGGAQTNVPITFGQVFAVGEVPSGSSVAGKTSSGAAIPLQVNVKATHADGSARHAIISAILPSLASGQTESIAFTSAVMGSTTPVTPTTLLAAGFTARVDVAIGGITYSAAAENLLAGSKIQWLAGSIANEWIVSAPIKTASNVAHPHLTARFAIRSYAGSNKTKVDVAIENNRTFTAGSQNFTYDAKVFVGGAQVDTITALEHYHHARWHKTFWWGTAAPQIHVKHNTDYLIASKAVPSYDRSVVPAESAIAGLVTSLTADKVGPMKAGLALPYMPNTGGRKDIGPLPGWYVLYLLSMDKRAKDVMLSIADGSGSWPIHYRDETDANDMPVRIDKTGNDVASNAPYKDISINSNLVNSGPLPVPRCANGSTTLCVTPLTPDTSHQPSLVYLPYLVTGDYYYLEELQFWASWNPLGTGGLYRDYAKGLVRWDQIRGQAWDLRTLGQVAYITPDAHPMKQYFQSMVSNNLSYFNTVYTSGNPNLLGILDGAEANAFKAIHYPTWQVLDTGISTFQDDFFTWSIGHLAELGFTEAQPLLQWKSKFPVGRMTDPAYCWTLAAVFVTAVRPSTTSPLYGSLADVYAATFQNLVGKDGTKLIDKACGSQAQADWLTQNSGNGVSGEGNIQAGEMIGYSDSAAGFPSNMQPALAVAVASGVSNAQAAWVKFINRTDKPNYSLEPQWAIVPRQ